MVFEFYPEVRQQTGRIVKAAKDVVKDAKSDRVAALNLYNYFKSVAEYKTPEDEKESLYTRDEIKQARTLMVQCLKLSQDSKVAALRAIDQLIIMQRDLIGKGKAKAKKPATFEEIANFDTEDD